MEIQGTQAAEAIVSLRTSLGQTQPLLDRVPKDVIRLIHADTDRIWMRFKASCFSSRGHAGRCEFDILPDQLRDRGVQWADGQPSLRPGEPLDSPSKALVTQKEISTTVRYAESPQRVSGAVIYLVEPC